MNNQGAFAALGVALLGVICVVLLIVLVIAIFFLLTMQKALSRCSPRNRLMEPGMVWLMLIPCVNIVWQFMIAINVPGSLKNEFRDRGRDDGSDYGKSLGLIYCIVGLVSAVIGNGLGAVPDLAIIANGVSGVMSMVGLVVGIMFWVKIAGYSSRLEHDDRGDVDRRLDQFDDDDDDRDRDYPEDGGSPRKPSPDTYREGDGGRYQ